MGSFSRTDHHVRNDTVVAASGVVQISADGSPMLTVTCVIPKRMQRSSTMSEHVAMLLAGHFRDKVEGTPLLHLVPDC